MDTPILKNKLGDSAGVFGAAFIENLNDAYNYFFSRYKNSRVMIVNCEEVDFVNNQADLEYLIDEVFKSDRAAVEYYNPLLRKAR